MAARASKPTKKADADQKNGNSKPSSARAPTEKEVMLANQLTDLSNELHKLRQDLAELQSENDWLQQEAQQTRVESHEYMSYMSKKTQKRQHALISLSDYNAHEIKKINERKEAMIQEYEEKKGALKDQQLLKEAELNRAQKELEELEEYQILLNEQETEVKSLEKLLADKRIKHTETVQGLKATFLRQKHQYQLEADQEIQDLTVEVNEEARRCLREHSWKIKAENRRLRKNLLDLICKTRALHKRKLALEEQHRVLLREEQYMLNINASRCR